MVKNSAWFYLDQLVTRRRSLTLSYRVVGGGFAAVVNGHNFGMGSTCKKAVVRAVRNSKRMKAYGR